MTRLAGRHPSLRLRITAGALVVLIASLSGAGLLVIRAVQAKMTRQIDAALEADANFTQRAMTRGSGLPTGEGPTDLYVQFVAADGRVAGAGTAAAGLPALASPRAARRSRIVSHHDPVAGDLRVLSQRAPTNPPTTLVLARSSASVAQMHDLLIELMALLITLGSVTLGALVWVVVGRALRPVDAMRRTVDRIDERDLRRRLTEPGTGDELDALAATLNQLLDRVDAAVTRESMFVADASHELRTPIAGVRALLETEPADPADVVAIRAEALARLGHLQDLVDDLLVLARADAGPEQPRRAVDLDELVLAMAHQLRGTTTLDVETSQVSGGQVLGRDTDLGRLVENLATNAVRYARTKVAFSVRQDAGIVELAVSDDGPGIAAADAARVFERFSTLEEVRGPDRAGAGLGLSIVAAIVATYDGSVHVEDAAGGGARFVVRLPAPASLVASVPAAEAVPMPQ